VDPDVLSLDQELKNQSFQNKILFKKLTEEEQQKLENDFIVKAGGQIKITKVKKMEKGVKNTKISTLDQTKLLLEKGLSLKEIAKERGLTTETVISHIEKIIAVDPKIKIDYLRPKENIIKLVMKAQSKIKDKEDRDKLKPVKDMLDKDGYDISYPDIRLARLFI
jgi:uncharacterized protein YpbB